MPESKQATRKVTFYYPPADLAAMQKILIDEAPLMGRVEVSHDEVGRALTHLYRQDPALRARVRNYLKGLEQGAFSPKADAQGAKGRISSTKKIVQKNRR